MMLKNFTFIINGHDADLVLPTICRLRGALRIALRKTKNTGRPLTNDWEIRDTHGHLLDKDLKVGDLHDGQRIFATLRVGAGGQAWLDACLFLHSMNANHAFSGELPWE